MSLEKFLESRSNRTGYKEKQDPDIVDLDFNLMKQDYELGVQRGEETGVGEMNENFSWMRGHQNCWTGWANSGKTTFLNFMMLMKSIKDGWKWVIWSPEMQKANFIEGKVKTHFNAIAYELMSTITGKTPYKHVSEKYNVGLLTLDQIQFLKEWIEKHFVFLDPEQRDIKYVIDMHQRIYDKIGFDGFVLDPYKNIKAEIGKRDDQHLSDVFSKIQQASVRTNSVFNWIAHPKSGNNRTVDVNGQLEAAPCTQSMLSGGAAWDNSMDGIYSILRPHAVEVLTDNRVRFYNLKQRMQELTAQRGTVEDITFDIKTRRYLFNGRDPLTYLKIDGENISIDNPDDREYTVWDKAQDWEDQISPGF